MKHLKRDTNNEIIAGVCAGFAKYMGIDPFLFRLIFAVAAILGAGSPILIYGICWVIMPEE